MINILFVTVVKSAYDWLLCWLLRALDKQLHGLESKGLDRFTARGQVQAFYAKPLALAYGEVSNLHCNEVKSNILPRNITFFSSSFFFYRTMC